jgi:hypothetical protein
MRKGKRMTDKINGKTKLYLQQHSRKRIYTLFVVMTVVLLSAILSTMMIRPAMTVGNKIVQSSNDDVRLVIGAVETTRNIDQAPTSVLRWSAEIENEYGLENLVYVNTLIPENDSYSMEYVTSYPILLTSYKDSGALKQSYYYWTSDNVTLSANGHSFSILLPESSYYDAYSIDYYTTYDSAADADKTYLTHGALQQKVDDDYLTLVENSGEYSEEISAPEIDASIYGDDNGISYSAKVTIPSGNNGLIFNAGGGMTVEKDDEVITIPIAVADVLDAQVTVTTQRGEVIEFDRYIDGNSAENTYSLAINDDHSNVYSVDMFFNTDTLDVWESNWNFDEEAVIEVKLTIPMTVTDDSGKSIAEYLSEGYNVTNHFFGRFQGYGLSEGTASYCNVVQKSSDLNEFVTALNIYDTENVLQVGKSKTGEEVNNSLYVNRKYIYELYFEERNNPGDYFEMKPDESGYMTYALPIQVHPLGDDLEPQEITLSNGKAVAEFFIENQTIKLKFYDVDEYGNPTPGTSWIDSPGLKKLNLRFEGSFSSGASDTIDLNIGEDFIVRVDVVDDSELKVKKQAGDYDPVEHTVAYSVTVSGNGNGVRGLTLTDIITSNNGTIITDSVTAKVGDEEKENPVCVLNDDGSYIISDLPDFNKDEVLTVEYLVHINDDVAAYSQVKGNVRLTNTVEGNAKSPQGKLLSDTSSAQKDVTVTNLAKSGYSTKVNNTPVIQWTATVGDGSYDVGGLLLEDTLGEYLTLYKDRPITVEAVKRNGSVSQINVQWFSDSLKLSESEDSFELTLPKSDANNPYTLFRVRYYTTYETQESFTVYHNTVNITLNGNPMGVTGSCSIAPPGNVTIQKTGVRNGDYLDWTITVDMPAGLYGTRGVYITEYYDGVVLLDDGRLAYKSADLTNAKWNVSVETESGEVINFNRYKGNGITENTYSIAWNYQYQDAAQGKYNNTRAILFNCTGLTTWDSTWMINEKSTITINVSVPITNGISGGYTAEEALDDGGYMSNLVQCYVAESNKGRSTAIINGEPLHKSGEQSDEKGVIDYAVTLRNNDHVNNSSIMNAQQTQNMEFVDEFDERLEYVAGTLKLELKTYETSSSSGNLIATFKYDGDVGEDGTLRVSAEQFVNDSGKTLKEFAAAQKGNSWYNLFFTYQLKIKDAYKDSIAAKLQLDNTATLRWGTDDTEYLTADATVTYKTGLLKKMTVDAPENGETLENGNVLKYQIELNPEAADLDPNSDVLIVLDTLPDCLNIIWDNENQVNVIGEYWDEDVGWVEFESSGAKSWQKGYYYDKTLEQNVLKFQVPDNCYVRITYECQVTEYGASVQIVNQVSIRGQTLVEDSVESMFKVNVKTGTAESDDQQFAIIKTDSSTHNPMANVKFVLYSLESRTNRVPTDSRIPTEITGKDNRTYYYFGVYETDSSGYCLIQGLNDGGKYILREYEAPVGYQKMDDIYIQYSQNPLEAEQITNEFVNVFKNQTLSVVNDPVLMLLETGGSGTGIIYIISSLMIVLSVGGLLLRKRHRRKAVEM